MTTTRKLTILVDVDSTICDTLPVWLERIHAKTGVKATVSDITSWGVHACGPLVKVDPAIVYGVLNEPGFNLSIPIFPGVKENIKKLMDEGHTVYFVTARYGGVCMGETLEWFKEHLPFVGRTNLVFCSDKELLYGDVLVDDRAETVQKFHTHRPPFTPFPTTISILYPYNQTLLDDPRCRVVKYTQHVWNDIYGIINKASKGYGEYIEGEIPEATRG